MHYYFYENGVLVYEKIKYLTNSGVSDNPHNVHYNIIDQHDVYYLYDENQNLYGIIFDGKKYYYLKDAFNNILGIINEDGQNEVYYFYDAYGNILNIYDVEGNEITSKDHIGHLNPFRYKCYYYDEETGLFWLSSRYYSPELCRFISPDSIEYLDPTSINGLNLYAYCGNDPINYADHSGHIAISTIILLACIGVGAVVGGTYAGVTAYNDGVRGWELVGWTALGAIVGGTIGGLVGYYAGPIVASLFGSGGGFALADGLGSAGVAISGTMAGTLVPIGALGLTSVGALVASGVMMFAKGNGPRMGHNQYENKQFNSLCNKYNLTKEQRRILHDYISGQNYSYHEIEQLIIELFFSK